MNKKMTRTGRFVAADTLCHLDRERKPVKSLLDRLADRWRLSPRERSLAMNLVYGVLRQRQYLDLLLAELCRQPLSRLDPFVHQALAVGLYQLFCLDRIPERAAVHETVEAVKCARLPARLQGFVNGVLRTAIRRRSSLPGPGAPGPDGHPVSNHPQWLTDRWIARFGRPEMERICRLNNQEPRLVLRANSRRSNRLQLRALLAEAGIVADLGTYASQSLVLPDYQGPISALPGYNRGLFQVQDEAAQLASLLLGPLQTKACYLDGCAGLGGKTSHLLELAAPQGARVRAVEPDPTRQRLLLENIARLHGEDERQIDLVAATLEEFAHTRPLPFAGVLIDAPCSGTGVIGRHPDIRWNREPADLPRYQRRQLELLECGARLLAPGGLLVYATCSIEAEENRGVVDRFLATRKDFALTDCTPFLPEAARCLVMDGCFSPRPDESIDGFFAARLIRHPAEDPA